MVRSRLLTGAASYYSILVNPKYSAALATDNVDRCVLAPSSPRRQPPVASRPSASRAAVSRDPFLPPAPSRAPAGGQ